MVKIWFDNSSIFPSLNLVFSEKFMMFLSKENRFLLSVNVIGSKIFDTFCRSFNILETKKALTGFNSSCFYFCCYGKQSIYCLLQSFEITPNVFL